MFGLKLIVNSNFFRFQGTHSLKWVFRKNCFSFGTESYIDKAFIRSITLVSNTIYMYDITIDHCSTQLIQL